MCLLSSLHASWRARVKGRFPRLCATIPLADGFLHDNGLKQAPRQWYWRFDSFMTDQGYQKTQADHCVFVKKFEGGDFLILLLYVDDMLIVGRDQAKIRSDEE